MYGFHADRCMDFSMSGQFLGSSKKSNNKKINKLPLSRLATQQTRSELNSRQCTGLICPAIHPIPKCCLWLFLSLFTHILLPAILFLATAKFFPCTVHYSELHSLYFPKTTSCNRNLGDVIQWDKTLKFHSMTSEFLINNKQTFTMLLLLTMMMNVDDDGTHLKDGPHTTQLKDKEKYQQF